MNIKVGERVTVIRDIGGYASKQGKVRAMDQVSGTVLVEFPDRRRLRYHRSELEPVRPPIVDRPSPFAKGRPLD